MSYIKRFRFVIIMLVLIASGALYKAMFMDWSLVYNATISIPKGWYFVKHRTNIVHGDLVLFDIPDDVESLLRARGWINDRIHYLIKPVAGLSGEHACIKDQKVVINGENYGATKSIAKDGAVIPQIEFCGVIPREHFMVAVKEHGEDSFDSRYMGAVHQSRIEGIATPLWTW